MTADEIEKQIADLKDMQREAFAIFAESLPAASNEDLAFLKRAVDAETRRRQERN